MSAWTKLHFGTCLRASRYMSRDESTPTTSAFRVTGDEQFRGIAGTAAQIDSEPRTIERYLHQEVASRSNTLIMKLEVLPRAPVNHQPCNLYWNARRPMA